MSKVGPFGGISALSHTNTLKQGFLFKSSPNSNIKKNYTKRWFILVPQYLLYYVDDGVSDLI